MMSPFQPCIKRSTIPSQRSGERHSSNNHSTKHTTGTLRGQVSDPAGATVAGASVTVRNDANRVSQTTVTSSAGTYEGRCGPECSR